MSKSLGNFFSVRQLLDQGVPGEVIRFVFLSTHYRKPMDWTEKKVREAEATLRKWRKMAGRVGAANMPSDLVVKALADDMNTAGAIAEMHKLEKQGHAALLKASANFLGLLSDQADLTLVGTEPPKTMDQTNLLADIADKWQEFRNNGDYNGADAFKAKVAKAGADLTATGDGPQVIDRKNCDFDKLKALK